MTIYIDITQLEKSRANTGIQRVVREFLKRALKEKNIVYKIFSYNESTKNIELFDNKEVVVFLNDFKNYSFTKKTTIDFQKLNTKEVNVLFELDAIWNAPLKRKDLYPIFKHQGFLIVNFIYDLTPVLLPNFANEITVENFTPFLDAVYKYSDRVFTDSFSSETDFLDRKKTLNVRKSIPTNIVSLGSDFFQDNKSVTDPYIQKLLEKKYILFVGTLEPRKNQENVLEAFEKIAHQYPDLNLIFIGKEGWKIQHLVHKIQNHKLKDKQFFWLNFIDDDTLTHFYKNAFLVTYLSKYEGYGLPISESLSYGNITITTKNSSLYEVGKDCADYIQQESNEELIEKIRFYCDNKAAYRERREYIQLNFKPLTWDMFYDSVLEIMKSEYN